MSELLGTRYCEPSKMKRKHRYNDVSKTSLDFCVQGAFTCEDVANGEVDTRWQTLGEMAESCSREDFNRLTGAYIKALQKSFAPASKRFKTTAQLAEE